MNLAISIKPLSERTLFPALEKAQPVKPSTNFRIKSLTMNLGKILAGSFLVVIIAALIQYSPDTEVYAALSAAIALLYVAALADVSRAREGAILLIPAVVTWLLLAYDMSDPLLIGITLLGHTIVAFDAIVRRSANSLQELGLWPFLLGLELMAFTFFVFL